MLTHGNLFEHKSSLGHADPGDATDSGPAALARLRTDARYHNVSLRLDRVRGIRLEAKDNFLESPALFSHWSRVY